MLHDDKLNAGIITHGICLVQRTCSFSKECFLICCHLQYIACLLYFPLFLLSSFSLAISSFLLLPSPLLLPSSSSLTPPSLMCYLNWRAESRLHILLTALLQIIHGVHTNTSWFIYRLNTSREIQLISTRQKMRLKGGCVKRRMSETKNINRQGQTGKLKKMENRNGKNDYYISSVFFFFFCRCRLFYVNRETGNNLIK